MPRPGAKSLPVEDGEERGLAGPAEPACEVCEEGCNTDPPEPTEPSSPRKDAATDPYEQSGEMMATL